MDMDTQVMAAAAAVVDLLRNRTLILYCDRGGLSMKAAKELIEMGYNAKSVVGGIEAYFH